MTQKLIILGHSGFLGQCLCDNFLKDPNYEICGFSSVQLDLSAPGLNLKLIDIVDGASLIMAASALTKSKDLTSFNKDILMFINLANSALISKIKHFIYISSIAIYGCRSDLPVTEASAPNIDSFYSSAKLIGELIFKQVCADQGIGLTILRPGIFYGRGDIRSPLFRFINNVRMGKEIEMYGDESSHLFWIHKNDMCRVISSVVNDFKLGDYNVVSEGDGISLPNLAEAIFKLCGRRTGIKFISSQIPPKNIRFDTSRFKTDFPRFKFINFEDGIKEYLIP